MTREEIKAQISESHSPCISKDALWGFKDNSIITEKKVK